tara:strand:+ start:2382 stop:3419 length:1038 start_codon:yes stop_codon:yes gene_type:complete
MAGADQFTGRGGQSQSTGADDALFLKQFSGEVLSAFDEFNVMMPLHTVRSISSGKSAQFPVIGTTSADYHTAGTDMLEADGANSSGEYDYKEIQHAEKTIGIDQLLVSPQLIPSIDEARSHYDYRSEYSRQMGAALARQADRHLIRTMIRAAHVTGLADPFNNGGGQISLGGASTTNSQVTSAKLVDALFKAAATLDDKDVPNQDRHVVLNPTLYYALIGGGNGAFSTGVSVANTDIGGSGFDTAIVPNVAGFSIHKSNNVQHVNDAKGNPTGRSSLNDYSTLVTDDVLGLVFHKSAIGTVKLLDLSVESEYLIQRQSTFMVAKYAMGHGVLRPEAAIALIVDDA